MATLTPVNRGTTPGDGTGDTAYDAFGKVNDNDAALNTELTSGANPGHTHTLNQGATDITATAAEVNLLDLSGLTSGWVLAATGAATASWQALDFADLGITPTTLAGYGITDAASASHTHTVSEITDLTNGVEALTTAEVNQLENIGATTITAANWTALSNLSGTNTGDDPYTLPLAANGTRGGIQIGYTENGKNYPVELSSEKAFVNVPWTDTVYSLPLAANGTRGGVQIGYTENGKNYPVELSSEKMFVNVPWTDTVYSHPSHPGDDFSVDSGALTGATVISDIDINVTTDTLGHVTDANGVIATRALTAGDIGAATSGHIHSNYIDSTASDTASGATYTWSNGSVSHIFDGSGNSAKCRITRNDGGGNWNFRAGHYYSSGDKFSNTSGGAALIRIDTDSSGGVMFFRTAETGTADTAITWDANIQFDNTAFDSDVQMQAPAFVTDGGTSSQFVKGDGSLDSTTYWSSHADTSSLSGTYGSTANGTKIDQITVDSNGHITAITTGATGDILGVTAGTDITGGGTSGTVTINLDPTLTSVTSMYNTSLQVGYSSTTAFIDFNSTAMDFEWSSAPEFRMTSTGNFHADADITAYSSTTTSDRRYKKDIEIIPNALDKINTLNGVTFKWKRDDKKSAGLIAQDVEKVLPQAVCVKEALKTGEEYLALNYDCVVGMLVEAVKELTARVEELENGKH